MNGSGIPLHDGVPTLRPLSFSPVAGLAYGHRRLSARLLLVHNETRLPSNRTSKLCVVGRLWRAGVVGARRKEAGRYKLGGDHGGS